MQQGEHGKCCCICHKMPGVFIALIGLDFLLGAMGILSERFVQHSWPVLLILIGLKKSFGQGRCKCCAEGQKPE